MSKDWQVVENESAEAWDAFVARSPQRSIFVQSAFLASLQTKFDLVTVRENGSIIAGVAIGRDADGKPVDGVVAFTQYQGILLADYSAFPTHSRIAREFKLLEFFIAKLAARYGSMCLCNSWRLADLRPFQWHNYHEPAAGRFSVDLRYSAVLQETVYGSFDVYLTSVRDVRRQEYVKASRSLRLTSEIDEETFAALYEGTFARQGIEVPADEMAMMQSILRGALAGGYGQLAAAYLDDVPVSANLFIYDDRTAYYLFGANDPAHRKSFGGTFLLMSMVKDAFERGLSEVDFVGANSPNRGDFKLSLNADLRPYFVTTL